MVNRKKKQKSFFTGKPQLVETSNEEHPGGSGMENLEAKIVDKDEEKRLTGVLEAVVEDVEKIEMSKTVAMKRKRGPDKEIAEAFFQSSEMGSSRLRPRKDIPSFHRVLVGVNDFERIVGKRIKVFWPDSRRWFSGKIKSFDNVKKLHTVLYDDGDKEYLNLTNEKFELEVTPSEAFTVSSRLKPNSGTPDTAGESRDTVNEGSHIIDGAGTRIVGPPENSEGVQITDAHSLENRKISDPVKRYVRTERKPSEAAKKRHPKLQVEKGTATKNNLLLGDNDNVSEQSEHKMMTDEVNMDKIVGAGSEKHDIETGKKELDSDGGKVIRGSAKEDITEVNDVKQSEKMEKVVRKISMKAGKKSKINPKVKWNSEDEKTVHLQDMESDALTEIVDKKKSGGKIIMAGSEDGFGKDETGLDAKPESGSKDVSDDLSTQTENHDAVGVKMDSGDNDKSEEEREEKVQGSLSLASQQGEKDKDLADQEAASDGGPEPKSSDSLTASDAQVNEEESRDNVENQENPTKKVRSRAKSRK